jgi:integrase/recombinase XerD
LNFPETVMPKKGDKNAHPQPFGDPSDPQGFGVLCPTFLEWMRIKNYSENTIAGRQHYLGAFVSWCQDRGITQPAEVTKALLERYQRWLYHYRKDNGKALTFSSQSAHLVPVRAFFKWCARKNHTLYNPAGELDMPKLEKRLPKHVLTASEADRVLNQANVADALGVRDRAILETFYSSGIRRLELSNLKLYDLDVERGTMMVRMGKGKKDRMIPIGERALAWIDRYITEVRPTLVRQPDDGVLFLSNQGEMFSPNRLTQLVREYVAAADIGKSGSCHLFRHTMATLMLEGGADIRFIQQMLGHVKLDTTQIYAQVSIRKLKEIHTLTHPAKLDKPGKEKPEEAQELQAATPASPDAAPPPESPSPESPLPESPPPAVPVDLQTAYEDADARQRLMDALDAEAEEEDQEDPLE